MWKRSTKVRQISGRNPLPYIIRTRCICSSGHGFCASRYRQISPMYWLTVQSYLTQSFQKLLAENLLRTTTVAPKAMFLINNKFLTSKKSKINSWRNANRKNFKIIIKTLWCSPPRTWRNNLTGAQNTARRMVHRQCDVDPIAFRNFKRISGGRKDVIVTVVADNRRFRVTRRSAGVYITQNA